MDIFLSMAVPTEATCDWTRGSMGGIGISPMRVVLIDGIVAPTAIFLIKRRTLLEDK